MDEVLPLKRVSATAASIRTLKDYEEQGFMKDFSVVLAVHEPPNEIRIHERNIISLTSLLRTYCMFRLVSLDWTSSLDEIKCFIHTYAHFRMSRLRTSKCATRPVQAL